MVAIAEVIATTIQALRWKILESEGRWDFNRDGYSINRTNLNEDHV